jgi:16S rRNA (uracil1498-N3)-methyltransferase
MPHNRYYIDAPLQKDAAVALTGDEWHHLVRVLRARKGDTLELINGRGQLAEGVVSELKKHDAEITVTQILEEKGPPPPLILAQAIPRMNHLEWIIEKGTELNATSFWLFPGLLSEKDTLSDSQRSRLKHLAVSAMKQCGRLDLPEIVSKPPLLEWPPTEGTLLFGDTDTQAPYLWDLSLSTPLPSPVILFIGPEKGFSQKERDFLLNHLNCKGVRLHPNILRAETAPLVALSLIQKQLL